MDKTTLAIYEPKYYIVGWYDNSYWLTAKQLLERVKKDYYSSCFGWIASATDLWRVISQPDFPPEIREDIASLIVNCFANLEDPHSDTGHQKPTDMEAVRCCYYTLPFGHPTRDDYLKAILMREIRLSYGTECDSDLDVLLWHSGATHDHFENNFIKTELEAAKNREQSGEKLNFEKWRHYLRKKYTRLYKKSSKNGYFQADVDKTKSIIHDYPTPMDIEELSRESGLLADD